MQVMDLYRLLNISEQEYALIVEKLGRQPNELETYLFSAMWSEHCGYKHSRKYLSRFPSGEMICQNDNAGGVLIGDHAVVFKVESHNHPSAVEPFQGAATGIGGIIRDILALGARPIALLDSLKFGCLSDPLSKHLFDGVVKGISSYGNSIGVPTVAGEVGFDESYLDSPLVNVMAVGLVKKDKMKPSKAIPGKVVIAVGSHTGRDGIHGASFASREISENSKEDRPSVQIGDPFTKKVLIEATLEILELSEVSGCQDFGAAGLLSSSSEMTYKGKCGIELHLDKIHLREKDMKPWEIMLSESQERMLFIVDENATQKVINIANKYDMPSSIIGKTTNSGLYELFWHGQKVASVPPDLLCNAPIYVLNEQEPDYINEYKSKQLNEKLDIYQAVKRLVSDPNFASKKWVYRQYDHTVGNRTTTRPGDGDAAGIWIFEEGGVLALTIDSNPRQVFLDPFNGARNSVWEAARNLISGGFTPLAITDCLNYGNPEKPEVAYQFVKSVDGITDACNELNIPVVSGNVSFYNESPERRVFPTPAIGMVGYVNSPPQLIRNSFLEAETLFLIGKQIDIDSSVGGSLYQRSFYNFLGGSVDPVDAELELKLQEAIFELREKQLLSGCIDVSEGGLFGAVFEGILRGKTGFSGSLIFCDDHEKALFGELNGCYVISTTSVDMLKVYLGFRKIPYRLLGKCSKEILQIDQYEFDIQELFDLYNNAISLEMDE